MQQSSDNDERAVQSITPVQLFAFNLDQIASPTLPTHSILQLSQKCLTLPVHNLAIINSLPSQGNDASLALDQHIILRWRTSAQWHHSKAKGDPCLQMRVSVKHEAGTHPKPVRHAPAF